jgi:hypothetical protein
MLTNSDQNQANARSIGETIGLHMRLPKPRLTVEGKNPIMRSNVVKKQILAMLSK